MPVTTDILASWRRPRAVMRRHLAAGVREDRALGYLMLAMGVIFVAQWPRLSREAFFAPEVPFEARLSGALLAIVFLAPLFFYALAAVAHLAARAAGGRGSFFGARMALFWALLAVSPAMLLQGLVAGFIGPGPAQTVVGLAVLAAFLMIWGAGLWAAEFERK
ncbi:YIP1 family protein [Frigidibacter oleivorans]|uniref:YIP1 family protein n=1 Tax=Frigidibacter oleivorans TaxID=2487129 RepID=UPI000F8DF75C|nr:YIP1 family protein [Frigidibacter oleivorans]